LRLLQLRHHIGPRQARRGGLSKGIRAERQAEGGNGKSGKQFHDESPGRGKKEVA
jgi:hypothetical protein